MYYLYRDDFLPCPYCSRCVNLYYAKHHLKTKKCKEFQRAMTQEEYHGLLLTFYRKLNKLKSDIRLEEIDENINSE